MTHIVAEHRVHQGTVFPEPQYHLLCYRSMRSPRMAVADTQLRALTCLLSRGCYHEKCGHQRPSLFLCSSDKEFPPQLCGSSYAGEIQVTAEDKME